MATARYCNNVNCSCAVSNNGDSCCADCDHDASDSLPGACSCGHSDCEPSGGMELDSEVAEVAMA
jgi:hypothetical protein